MTVNQSTQGNQTTKLPSDYSVDAWESHERSVSPFWTEWAQKQSDETESRFFPVGLEDLPLEKLLEINDDLIESLQPKPHAIPDCPQSSLDTLGTGYPHATRAFEPSSIVPQTPLVIVVPQTSYLAWSPKEMAAAAPLPQPQAITPPNLKALTPPKPKKEGGRDEKSWKSYFEALQEYYTRHGHCRVPLNGSNARLGPWVKRQRYLYKTARLTKERIEALESINFSWDAHEDVWDSRYDELCEFHQEHGHANVTSSHPNKGLMRWVQSQRRLYKKNQISIDRIERLEKVGFAWSVREFQKQREYPNSLKVTKTQSVWCSDWIHGH